MVKKYSDLKPLTICKRVMNGTKDRGLLEAFGNLSSNDLHIDSLQVSYEYLLNLWNSLQKTPGRCRYMTFSLVHHNKNIQNRIVENFKSAKYAWIKHDKDDSAEHVHYHYLLMFPNAVSFSSIANILLIPVTQIQKVYSKNGILDYLTHENDKDKHHYDFSEIHANFDIQEEKQRSEPRNVLALYDDFCLIRNGLMTPRDFLDKYSVEFSGMNMCSLLQSFGRLSDAFSTGASLSSRAQCRVPKSPYFATSKSTDFATHNKSSSSDIPIQTVFPELSTSSIDWLEDGQKVAFDIPKSPPKKSNRSYRRPNPRSDLNDLE